jgi:hypothetical protein
MTITCKYEGNRLRFGKVTMNDTDLVLLDMDPKDPFDFYLDRYKDQLVAGYTKNDTQFWPASIYGRPSTSSLVRLQRCREESGTLGAEI